MAARKGDVIIVVKDDNADWVKVRKESGAEEGFVPRSFLNLETQFSGSEAEAKDGLSSGLI